METFAKKVPTYLLTGYLGSGKTTLLKRLVETYRGKTNIAVVQNEFAPGNIDGSELKHQFKDLQILEINNGSVFCVCRLSDFVVQASEFIRLHRPDLLIIEASGLSDPIAIQQIMALQPLVDVAQLSKIWTVVDAAKYLKLSQTNLRVKHQLAVADEIIINKCDLVGQSDLEAIESSVRSLNKIATIHHASYCEIEIDLFPARLDTEETTPWLTNESSRPDINVAMFKSRQVFQGFDEEKFFAELPDAQRIKGFIRLDNSITLQVQGSFEQRTSQLLKDYKGNTELVSIGGSITPRKLRAAIKKAQSA